jgi:hypothetical protein
MVKADKPKNFVHSAYAAWMSEHRAAIVSVLPERSSIKEIAAAVTARWRELTPEQRAPYVERRNAYLRSIGKDPAEAKRKRKDTLVGWVEETIKGKKCWTHEASGVLVWRKPQNKNRVVSGINRRRFGKLGDYNMFVKENFKTYKSLKACGEAWQKLKESRAGVAVDVKPTQNEEM